MRHLGVSLVVFMGMVIGTAHADPKPENDRQQKADALFEEGRKALNDEKNPTKACDLFNSAIKLDPDADGTMLNLGLCNEQLHKYRAALYWFRKAQARASETNLPDHEAAAKAHTLKLNDKIGTVKIKFAGQAPDGAKVKIDGEEIKPDEYLRVEIDPGHHALDAGAPGHKLSHQEFDVVDKGGQELAITLVEGDDSVIVDRGKSRRKIAIITAISGGALMVVAGGLSLYERHVYCNQFAASSCGIQADLLPDDPAGHAKAANDAHDTARWVATPIFAVGLTAVAVGVILYVTAPAKERQNQTVFAPVVTSDQVGFALSGGF